MLQVPAKDQRFIVAFILIRNLSLNIDSYQDAVLIKTIVLMYHFQL